MKIISRKEALEQGLKRYFTGKTCKHGHVSERYIKGSCCECSKLAKSTKEYVAANKGKNIASYLKRVHDDPIKIKLQLKKSECKRGGIPFNITRGDICIPDICPLLGIPVEITLGKGASNRENGWSIDRLDPLKGYVKGNVWVISGKANRMKQDMTPTMMRHFADVIDIQINKEHT